MFRKCCRCRKLVPGKPLDPTPPLCENHKNDLRSVVYGILGQRYVDINFFRIYDKDRKQLCIFCGDPTSKRSRTFCNRPLHNSMMYDSEINGKYNMAFIKIYHMKNRCHICEKSHMKVNLQYHHIIPVSKLDETNWLLAFNPRNLITLCESCHKSVHKKNAPYTQEKPLEV